MRFLTENALAPGAFPSAFRSPDGTVAIYFEAALIIAVLGFASSVALAKFLMRGEVIE